MVNSLSSCILTLNDLRSEKYCGHVLEWLADYWADASEGGLNEAQISSPLIDEAFENLTREDIKTFSFYYEITPADLFRNSVANFYQWMTYGPFSDYFRYMMQHRCKRMGGLSTIDLSSFSLYGEELTSQKTMVYSIEYVPPSETAFDLKLLDKEVTL